MVGSSSKGHIPAVIAFIIYLIAGNAECNRGPFDLPEAESELTAGYHTEYSGMGFGFFYLAEYLNLFIVASVAATIFLGGWMPLHIVGLDGFNTVMDYIPGFHLVLRQSILCGIPSDVDQMDFPTFAYRPDLESGMEIPGSNFYGKSIINGMLRSFRLPLLINENYGI